MVRAVGRVSPFSVAERTAVNAAGEMSALIDAELMQRLARTTGCKLGCAGYARESRPLRSRDGADSTSPFRSRCMVVAAPLRMSRLRNRRAVVVFAGGGESAAPARRPERSRKRVAVQTRLRIATDLSPVRFTLEKRID